MRELPLSVWKARRTVVSSPRSSAASASAASAACAFSMTSRASSRKTSRISASSSRPVEPAGVGCGSDGAGGAAASRRAPARHGSVPASRVGRGAGEVGHRLRQLVAHGLASRRSSAARRARPAPCCMVSASAGWSATSASCDRRSRSRDTSASGTSGRTAADASDCACSIRRGSTGAARGGVEAAEAGRAVLPPPPPRAAAGLGVEDEQRLGHLRLHAEHVDQEAERAEVAGQAVERSVGLRRRGGSTSVGDERVDVVAHAQHGLRGLVQAEHREHAAHRLQLARHRDQHLARGRVAEELVDRLLGLGQRAAQLLHHAAHGLAIGDAAVQLLHPRLRAARAVPPWRTAAMRCARRCTRSACVGWSKSPSSSEASR